MIPIRDDTPTYSTPFINYLLVALNVAIYVFQAQLSPSAERGFIYTFGVVPVNIEGALGLGVASAHHASLITLISSMFLHAGWWHVLSNMWFLWIFGDNIEDHLGHFPYLIFYLVSGIAASFCHILLNANSTIPSVGASGAIAGVMGAYFLLFPSARVLMLVPLFVFFTFIWIPAWIVLGYWFLIEFLSGAASTFVSGGRSLTGGIAVWAHVGGFVAGLVMIKIMPHRMRPRSRYSY
jgi:rhomboid family protein